MKEINIYFPQKFLRKKKFSPIQMTSALIDIDAQYFNGAEWIQGSEIAFEYSEEGNVFYPTGNGVVVWGVSMSFNINVNLSVEHIMHQHYATDTLNIDYCNLIHRKLATVTCSKNRFASARIPATSLVVFYK